MVLVKKEKTIGIVLASFLLLLTLSSAWYFLLELGVTPLQWAMFNACSPSSLIYLFCFAMFLWQKKVIWLPCHFADVLFRHNGNVYFHLEWN